HTLCRSLQPPQLSSAPFPYTTLFRSISAAADLDGAKAGVADAQAQLTSAQADQTYWSAEIKREQQLFDKGVVSRQELDQERSQRSEEHTLNSSHRTISYAVFCSKKKH